MKKKVVEKIKESNENSARRAILEDLFYDFNRSRKQIYWMNFQRGIFFAVGSVIGGTLVIALILWVLSLLVDLPGGVGNFVKSIVDVVNSHQSSK